MHRILPLTILLATYLALSANMEFLNIVLGLFIALGIMGLLHTRKAPVNWRGVPPAFKALAGFIVVLIRNVVKSGLQVTWIVLQPKMPLKSGIIAFPPECESALGQAIGSHAISLPPGELLIEMAPDGTMYIHSLDWEESRGCSRRLPQSPKGRSPRT